MNTTIYTLGRAVARLRLAEEADAPIEELDLLFSTVADVAEALCVAKGALPSDTDG